MLKQKLLLLFITFCTIWNSAKAQSYAIESLEGQRVKIKLTEKSTDRSWYSATVSCLTDTLILVDYNGVREAHVLGRNFLEIVYNTRGGTGSQMGSTVILSVSKNKINVALMLQTFGEAFGSDPDGSLYVVKFKMTGSIKSNFKLIAHIYDRYRSNSAPQKNYITNKSVILNYDPGQNIFYTSHKNITQSFTIENPKTQQSSKQKINSILPVIYLGRNSDYYYLQGGWYKIGYDNNLYKEYYK